MSDFSSTGNEATGRRQVLRLLGPGLLLGIAGIAARPAWSADLPTITMYKNPNCGCCGFWSKIMQAHGYKMKEVKTQDLDPVKLRAGVPEDLATCHTAFVGDYVVEGHVPPEAVEKMLREQPNILGIAVPGMPAGSPGMPSVDKEPFQVIAFDKNGKQSIYMSF